MLGGIGLILFSSIGLSVEFLWGTDLSMVGITYGIFLVFQSFQHDTGIFGYFTGYNNKDTERGSNKSRKLSFIDVLAIGLLFYLSTLEFIWGWGYFATPNALLIVEMIFVTIIWLGVLFWIFVFITVPINKMKHLKEWIKTNKIFRMQLIARGIGILLCIILLFFKIF